jgi:hypothetical protein
MPIQSYDLIYNCIHNCSRVERFLSVFKLFLFSKRDQAATRGFVNFYSAGVVTHGRRIGSWWTVCAQHNSNLFIFAPFSRERVDRGQERGVIFLSTLSISSLLTFLRIQTFVMKRFRHKIGFNKLQFFLNNPRLAFLLSLRRARGRDFIIQTKSLNPIGPVFWARPAGLTFRHLNR